MKRHIVFILQFLFLTSCSLNDEKNEILETNTQEKKSDSVDYVLTGKTKLWETVVNSNKDTITLFLREISLENKTNRKIILPISSYNGYENILTEHNLKLNERIIVGCVGEEFSYKTDPNGKVLDSAWTSNTGCGIASMYYILNPKTKELFYGLPFNPNTKRLHEDSLVYSIKYWLDSFHPKTQCRIYKNLYTSKDKLFEIDHFHSLDHLYDKLNTQTPR